MIRGSIAAMTDLAHHLGADELPAQEVVDFLLSHYGMVETSPHFCFARGSGGPDDEIRARAAEEFALALHAGAVGRIGMGIDRSGGELMHSSPDFKRRRSRSGRRSRASSVSAGARAWRGRSTPPTAIRSWR